MNRQLGLRSTDLSTGRCQLSPLCGREPRSEVTVDAVLTAPREDWLLADPEISSELGSPAARIDQIHGPAMKLRWITAPCHTVLLEESSNRVQ